MDPILAEVNPEQQHAIMHGRGPLLVVAGAGSGKTRVITRRVAYLVQQGALPYQVTALTFTNKAAREMRDRVQQLVPAKDLWVCTFHSFAARTLRRYADRIGYTREYSIYDTEDRIKLIKELLKEKSLDTIRPNEIVNALGRIKNRLGGLDQSHHRSDQIAEVIHAYEARMRGANAMDFDDLLVNLQKLLDNDEEARLRLQARCRWLLVDEYQDTNAVQYK
ncbi:MAG: UvrD-helicase domain-containing protein, partial [Planctomycetota bacterium]|nr:UvrD-helicase domain-containing protein [Planctomycetota bacterium]